jgi:hypothetical protein
MPADPSQGLKKGKESGWKARPPGLVAAFATTSQPYWTILPPWGPDLTIPRRQCERFSGARRFLPSGSTSWTSSMAQAASAPNFRPDPPSHHQDSPVRREPGGAWPPTPERIMWPPLQPGFEGRRLPKIRSRSVIVGLPFDPASRTDTGPLPRARLLQFGNRITPGIQDGLDREAHGYVSRAVENLKDLVADQTAEFAPGPLFGNEFNPAIAGVAFGADDVGLLHVRNMRLRWDRSSRFRCLSASRWRRSRTATMRLGGPLSDK